MFDIGFTELALLALLGLLILGPERLPQVARTIGRLLHRARSTWQQMRAELEREIDRSGAGDVRDDLRRARDEFEEGTRDFKQRIELDDDTAVHASQTDRGKHKAGAEGSAEDATEDSAAAARRNGDD